MFSKWGLSVLVLSLRIWGDTSPKWMAKQEKSSQLQKVFKRNKKPKFLILKLSKNKAVFIYLFLQVIMFHIHTH